MSAFELDKRLPSVDLTKSLVHDLEAYVIDEASDVFLADADDLFEDLLEQFGDSLSEEELRDEYLTTHKDVQEAYQVTIKDELGEETFDSIAKHRPTRFRDSTEEVGLRVWLHRPDNRLTISFGRTPMSTQIRLKIESSEGGAPRRRAVGIYKDILSILEVHKNKNWLVHPRGLWTSGLAIGGLTVIMVAPELLPEESVRIAVSSYGGLGMVLAAGVQFGNMMSEGRLVPYTQFDTQRDSRVRSLIVGAWITLVSGAVSAAFGVLLMNLW